MADKQILNISQESSGARGLLDDIIQDAVNDRASDIHFDPGRTMLHIRFRIDGILYPYNDFPNNQKDVIVSRIKVLAVMDTTKQRLPQDGHFEFEYNDLIYNMRVSSIPTTHGEAIVLRIFNKKNVLSQLDVLGFTDEQLDQVKKLITGPHGLFLITGPTGSGKTTLLYSILDELNTRSRSIVTLEDPVELEMKWMRQMQINEAINLGFAEGVRAILRQNPDIIMIGEIRDPITAQMGFQAALSGVKVFSTFHTFDVPGVVIRLLEMELPRSITAYGITAIIGTRLVRKICTKCVGPYTLNDSDRAILGEAADANSFKQGAGCEQCFKTGYHGRIGIYEVVPFDHEMRMRIIEDASISSLIKYLSERKYQTMQQVALKAAADGVTTVSEISSIMSEGLK